MRSSIPFFLSILSVLFFTSCEEEFIPEINSEPSQIVVEGFIEAGQNALPPYVILTRSIPFFSEFKPDTWSNLFIHNAEVIVNDGTKDYAFSEICFNDLTAEQKATFGKLLNINLDSAELNFCVYIDPSFQLMGKAGGIYSLNIKANGETVTAKTTIPQPVGLDSLWFEQPPGEPSDTLRRLLCYISDPAGSDNYYRYFTSVNDGAYSAGRNSVTDDKFFDGLRFKFPLARRNAPDEEFDPVTFGLFRIGEKASIKWVNMDKDHFDYWNTLEFNRSNQGPFSSYTRVKTNINGGLGIWGGYNVNYYNLIVK